MLFGKRLLAVRKNRKISQDKLAKAIGVHSPVIGRYERDEVKPSIEVAVKLAKALQVSLDFLVGNSDLELDSATLNRIVEIQKLKETDRNNIFYTLDALIKAAKIKNL